MSEGAVDIENQYYNSKGAFIPLCLVDSSVWLLQRHLKQARILQVMWSQTAWRMRSPAFNKSSRWRGRRVNGVHIDDPCAHVFLCLTTTVVHGRLDCRGFKAYKQIVKLQLRMGKHDEMLESYR